MNTPEYSFTIVNNEGIEVICDVLSMITDKDNRIYLLYTDYILDTSGSFRVLASELVQNKDDFILKNIEDKKKLNALFTSARELYKKTVNQ